MYVYLVPISESLVCRLNAQFAMFLQQMDRPSSCLKLLVADCMVCVSSSVLMCRKFYLCRIIANVCR